MQPSQPPGTLLLHTRSARKLLPRQLRTLVATINGHRVPLAWGVNYVPFPPGMHQVTVHNRFTRAPGPTIFIDNRHTPAPPVYYAEAWWYGQSALGYQPEDCPGERSVLLALLLPSFVASYGLGFFSHEFGWPLWLPVATTILMLLRAAWVIAGSTQDRTLTPPPPWAHLPGVITVHTSYPALASRSYWFREPKAAVNGREFPLAWGENHLPLPPPGIHRLKIVLVHRWWPWISGIAETDINTRPRVPTPVYYAAPYLLLMPGAIGHMPVKSLGRIFLVMLFVPVLVAFGGIIFLILGR